MAINMCISLLVTSSNGDDNKVNYLIYHSQIVTDKYCSFVEVSS